MRKTFQVHRESEIRLRASKSHLFQLEVDYLGFRVTAKRINMRDNYVDKILKWPVPQTPKELSSFLGFTGYYRSFIPEYTSLTGEMSAQKNKKALEWTEKMDEQFRTLKGHFDKRPLRSYPLYGGDTGSFEVKTDFSAQNLDSILEQVQGRQR